MRAAGTSSPPGIAMNDETKHPDDARLRGLLRAERATPGLPPGFQEAVWRRVQLEESAPQRDWLGALSGWLLQPRWAWSGLAAVMLMGGFLGVLTNRAAHRTTAQARYVAAVDPFQKGH